VQPDMRSERLSHAGGSGGIRTLIYTKKHPEDDVSEWLTLEALMHKCAASRDAPFPS
jgi:hypothetical protein